ncbi:A disintegrin and metalloproteinase with thrombospondin motifs gon-1-like [Anneissia japonica]|uniref:A disintegrin and metalloproteinase with thrombospondin motifs gon-1-like n=1 Tax=Anneissia japonica TaxID=1529436 RepID=UPI001425524C|nr:A disintegrin and metalloproteinase with thrombospondin motifs gon-1-like [Anneissia japonica]
MKACLAVLAAIGIIILSTPTADAQLFAYSVGDWSDCSATCGVEAFHSRSVSCISIDTGSTVDVSNCASLSLPDTVELCDKNECGVVSSTGHEYVVGEWGACTASCGIGYRTRSVECRNTATNGIEDISFCFELGNIALQQSCSLPPCPNLLVDLYVFGIGLWSDCSASCGIGIQTRSITCKLSSSQMVVDLAFCASLEPEPTVQGCLIADCVTSSYYYYTGPWSSCSSTCGTSFRERVIECREFESDLMVSDDLCDDLASEASQEICNDLPSCPAVAVSYEYYLTDYGTCSETCGVSYRTRDIFCRDIATMQTVDVVYCATIDPLDNVIIQELCNVPFCDTDVYEYATEEWSDCTATCGDSQRTRVAYCREISTGTVVDASLCSGLTEPSTSEPCIVSNCPIFVSYEYVTGEFSQCSASCGATAYRERTVLCRIVDTETFVDIGYCIGALPSTMESCGLADCPSLVYEYLIGEWSDCTATCGPAIQTRTVECRETVSFNVESVDTCVANGLVLVPTAQACVYIECPDVASYSYVIGEWSACSVSCATGTITRSVTCREGNTLAAVDVSVCVSNGLGEVTTTDDCVLAACPETFQYVATDWSACTVTCGTGSQTRDVMCVVAGTTMVVESSFCDSLDPPVTSVVCNEETCPFIEIDVSEWSACSSTCGFSTRSRTVRCLENTGVEISLYFCLDAGLTLPNTVEFCSGLPACDKVYSYVTGTWGSCSVTCASGIRSRSVICEEVGTNVRVDNSFCSGLTAPESDEICTLSACPTYGFITGDWSVCSVTCANGVRSRSVTCVEVGTNAAVENIFCAGHTAPDSSEICTLAACPTYDYITGDWSVCSVTCGAGIRTRDVACRIVGTTTVVSNDNCGATEQPTSVEVCTLQACSVYKYIVGEWGTCSVTCGAGQRVRTVTCVDTHSAVEVDISLCPGPVPDEIQTCELDTCIIYSFQYSAWTECSETCGDSAIRYRTATCIVDGTRDEADEIQCITHGLVKLSTEENCFHVGFVGLCPFYAFNLGEFGECSVTCGTGQRVRSVICLDIYSDVEVDISLCPGTVPVVTQSCQLDACLIYQYLHSEWSVCDCNNLIRSRAVMCAEISAGVAQSYKDEIFCTADGIIKPPSVEACVPEQGACEGNWVTGEWSECSVTCADGIQSRNVYCTDKFDATLTVADNQCNSDSKPDSQQACKLDSCSVYNYQFYASTWSDCSATCDEGIQTRIIICTEFVNNILTGSVADTFCEGIKRPSESQTCNLVACQGTFYAGVWGPCSVTCGCGVQTRVVECRLTKDKAVTAVVEDRCTGTKPIVEQECRNAACPEPFDCGTTYSEESGVIYSPQYPMSYPNDLDCTVTIDLAPDVIANVGSLVQIAITRFELEDETNCKFDNLQINDGVVTEILCGSMDALPYLITASGSTVHLTLHTDATITDAGYIITYTAVQPSPAP